MGKEDDFLFIERKALKENKKKTNPYAIPKDSVTFA